MTTVRVIRFLLALVLLGGGLLVGANRLNQLPPLGPFLDPANGVWAVARAAELPEQLGSAVPSLSNSAQVVYDRRGVPHIRATSVDDAVRALGFVVARDRLFATQDHAGHRGLLAEMVGQQLIDADAASQFGTLLQ